jgi:dTDP-glucose pyrophosphorylase
MNVVIPMAGRGSRFAAQGITVPKPLIDVRGRPMYAWAVDSLPLDLATRLIFVVLREHLVDRGLERDIRSRYGRLDPVVVPLDAVTAGQASTVLCVEALVDSEEPLLIFNADTYCRPELGERLATLPPDAGGVVSVFKAPGEKWSFARVDGKGRVLETAEKHRISEWAMTGLYHFAQGRLFVRHAKAMIAADERVNGEFYVAPVYNRILAEGWAVYAEEASEVWVLGTPEDLAYFEEHFPA